MRSLILLIVVFAAVAFAEENKTAPVPTGQPTEIEISALPVSVVNLISLHFATVYGEEVNITKASSQIVAGTKFIVEVTAHGKYFAVDDKFIITVFQPLAHHNLIAHPHIIEVKLASSLSGGFNPASRHSVQVLIAAQFALVESKQYGPPNVLEARVQIVAGVKYKLAIQVGASKVLKAVVYKPLNASLQLAEFSVDETAVPVVPPKPAPTPAPIQAPEPSPAPTPAPQPEPSPAPLPTPVPKPEPSPAPLPPPVFGQLVEIDIKELPASVLKVVSSHLATAFGETVEITKASRQVVAGTIYVLELTAHSKYLAADDKFVISVFQPLNSEHLPIISHIELVNSLNGGFNPAYIFDQIVLSAAEFAFAESKQNGTHSVLEARIQVVAGLKIKLAIKVGDSKVLKGIVYKPLHGDAKLAEYTVDAL